MDWIQVLTIVAANFGMFLWARSEANADRRDLSKAIIDFHGRLCTIEERNKAK